MTYVQPLWFWLSAFPVLYLSTLRSFVDPLPSRISIRTWLQHLAWNRYLCLRDSPEWMTVDNCSLIWLCAWDLLKGRWWGKGPVFILLLSLAFNSKSQQSAFAYMTSLICTPVAHLVPGLVNASLPQIPNCIAISGVTFSFLLLYSPTKSTSFCKPNFFLCFYFPSHKVMFCAGN